MTVSPRTENSVDKSSVEDFIVERLRDVAADGSLAREVRKNLDARIDARREAINAEGKALSQQIAKLWNQGRSLVEMLGQARGIAHRLIEERIEDVGGQLAVHERRLAERGPRMTDRAAAAQTHTRADVTEQEGERRGPRAFTGHLFRVRDGKTRGLS